MIFLFKLFAITKISIKTGLTYITSLWLTVFTAIMQITVFFFIWKAIYSGNAMLNNISYSQIIAYIILSKILWSQIEFGMNLHISDLIYNGSISIELLRPIDFQLYLYASRIGDFISFFFINALPVLFFSFIFFGFPPPVGLLNFILFFISIINGITIAFMVEFFIGLLAFYTSNGWGLQTLKAAFIAFLTCALVPPEFLPQTLKKIVLFLPFKDMVYTPISIYIGLKNNHTAFKAVIIQLLWILFLTIISRLFYRIVVKRVVAQGG